MPRPQVGFIWPEFGRPLGLALVLRSRTAGQMAAHSIHRAAYLCRDLAQAQTLPLQNLYFHVHLVGYQRLLRKKQP